MVKKSPSKKTKPEDGFDRLARLIKSESDDIRAEMKKGFSSVRFEMNEKFVEVHAELRAIRHELADINRRLDRLEEKYGSVKGYAKEIDEMRTRLKNIEKHLNLAR